MLSLASIPKRRDASTDKFEADNPSIPRQLLQLGYLLVCDLGLAPPLHLSVDEITMREGVGALSGLSSAPPVGGGIFSRGHTSPGACCPTTQDALT